MMSTKLKMATYNARGAFARLVWHLQEYGRRHGISVWLVQEHNLDPEGSVDHMAIARARGFDMRIGYADPGENGVHWGGTLIIAVERVVTLEPTPFTSASNFDVAVRTTSRGAPARPSEPNSHRRRFRSTS